MRENGYQSFSSPPAFFREEKGTATHGRHFFRRGGEDFFPFVHGSKMAIGEVMFLAAIAWVKRGEGGGRKILPHKKRIVFLLNKNCFFCHLLTVSTT